MSCPVKYTDKGFTLVEVLVAVIVMGFLVVGFLKLQTSSIMVRAHSKLVTTATQITSDFLDQVMASNPNDIKVDNETIADNGSKVRHVEKAVFTHNWNIRRDTPAAGLMTVSVDTSWKEKKEVRSVSLEAIMPQ